jgi:hypothetical protein
MQERRSFMSYDKNAYIWMKADETCWMGSVLSMTGPLTLTVEAYDIDPGDGFTKIELFGPGGALLSTLDCGGQTLCFGDFDVEVVGPTYFVAKATQADGNWLTAAPIWGE